MTAARPGDSRAGDEPVPGGDVVAAFDFDGTLTRGGSVWKFLTALRGRRPVAVAGAVLLPRLVTAALLGGHHADTAKEALFVRTLAGLDAAEVERRAALFGLRHFARRSRVAMRARLDWHRRQGHRIVIVSASPEYYVRAVGEELGVDGVVATRLAVDARGRLTGHFDGRNCRGEQKLLRLEEWMGSSPPGGGDGVGAHAGRPFLWAYGNSAGDRRLLEAADIGVDAGRLGRVGKLRRFRRLGDVITAW